MIFSLIIWILLSASVALVVLGVTYVSGRPGYYICPLALFPALYATTLLVVLNSRTKYKDGTSLSTTRKHSLHDIQLGDNPLSSGLHGGVVITVTRGEVVRDDLSSTYQVK